MSALGLGVILLVSACGTEPGRVAAPTETAAPSATPAPTPTPAPGPADYEQPDDCLDILPPDRLDAFAEDDLALLGGPGGKYGDDYLLEPSPEELAGGITCIWGNENNDIGALSISVAPLAPATRPGVIADLTNQGLNQQTEGKVSSFGQFGDEDEEPAILNVIRADSWISVISTPGGEDSYDAAIVLSNEVAATVYRSG